MANAALARLVTDCDRIHSCVYVGVKRTMKEIPILHRVIGEAQFKKPLSRFDIHKAIRCLQTRVTHCTRK